MNDKMGGDLEKIKTVGKYLVEVWKATGMGQCTAASGDRDSAVPLVAMQSARAR
jgi:hypothetical protein